MKATSMTRTISPPALDTPALETPPAPAAEEPLLLQRERQLLRDLVRLARERAAGEKATEEGFRSREEAADAEFYDTGKKRDAEYQAAKAALEAEFQQVRQDVTSQYEADRAVNDKEFATTRQRLNGQLAGERKKAESDIQESRWTIATVLDANKNKTENQYQDFQRKHESHLERIAAIRKEAHQVLGAWIQDTPEPALGVSGKLEEGSDDLLHRLKDELGAADAGLAASKNLLVLKLLKGKRFVWVFVLLGLVAMAPAAWRPEWYLWLFGGFVGSVVAAALAYGWLVMAARRQVNRVYQPLRQALGDAETLCQRFQVQVKTNYERQMSGIQKKHDAALATAEASYQQLSNEIQERRDRGMKHAEDKHRRRQTESTRRRDEQTAQAEAKYPALLAEMERTYEHNSTEARERHERLIKENKERHEREWQNLIDTWRQGLAHAQAETEAINHEVGELFPNWTDSAAGAWKPPETLPPVVRFGTFQINLSQIADGLPSDDRLKDLGPVSFALPALLSFPDACSLMWQANDAGRAKAEQGLQMVMFRLLTAAPPGKVRFTVIDPVGLGQSFAAFMHLADYEEALVTSRIWTEYQHIDQRLGDLTAHMENVIQKYLRNQYKTIAEYNAQAGEVAEPFRFLVVANFPANFSPDAARRLVSIASSGPRCGVHTLISVDRDLPMIQGFHLKDLEPHCVQLAWKDGRFLWKDPDFGKFPFRPDPLPDDDFATRALQVVGEEAKRAKRVEVPFEYIAPPADRWWTCDSRAGIDVPLGRAGATKRQHMQLGKGTSQHVLIAGKTGSGKSTLLHALITNVSLMYSPDEVELYLVDFKEGVEFKAYATNELPHARLVAIESEREFGLSVLQRLEAELKQRGDLFRAHGVQDLNGYRQSNGNTPLPRILLIVDEFQLFFIEDDKIAQDAALLLDRLVRQGRAFGIHVLLGSQTLGGAYSLARSTIGQMAVRIALQCSESDANLILSEDNAAARLLSRPGEAIYNAANGLVEGNDFFQVVWLGEEAREDYLKRLRALAEERHVVPSQPQIVFEGNAPAEVSKNPLLTQLLHMPAWPAQPKGSHAWLGEAMAIKDPTAALFRPQSGSNLLMVGQMDETALAIVTTALVSLSAQYPLPTETAGARFYVLDGSAVDSPHVGYLPRLASILPHPLKVVGWRDLLPVMVELAEEVERRQKSPDAVGADLFLVIYGLHRFRDLRRQEDDFGFSRKTDEPPNPAKLFPTILREGPAVGVYTLIWCDTLNNVNRVIDRQGLREFDMRVLFQMSAADSSNLIDSPLAGKLGLHRALFHSEDRGYPEKFRPYGLPSDAWLEGVKKHLHRGTV
jgi:predicted ATPase